MVKIRCHKPKDSSDLWVAKTESPNGKLSYCQSEPGFADDLVYFPGKLEMRNLYRDVGDMFDSFGDP